MPVPVSGDRSLRGLPDTADGPCSGLASGGDRKILRSSVRTAVVLAERDSPAAIVPAWAAIAGLVASPLAVRLIPSAMPIWRSLIIERSGCGDTASWLRLAQPKPVLSAMKASREIAPTEGFPLDGAGQHSRSN